MDEKLSEFLVLEGFELYVQPSSSVGWWFFACFDRSTTRDSSDFFTLWDELKNGCDVSAYSELYDRATKEKRSYFFHSDLYQDGYDKVMQWAEAYYKKFDGTIKREW